MDLTISISSRAEAKLREQASASGQDVTQYASELVERAVGESPTASQSSVGGDKESRLAAWEAFVAAMRDHAKTLPPGHVVDDSRESIYAGRGE